MLVSASHETLKRFQGDRVGLFTRPSTMAIPYYVLTTDPGS